MTQTDTHHAEPQTCTCDPLAAQRRVVDICIVGTAAALLMVIAAMVWEIGVDQRRHRAELRSNGQFLIDIDRDLERARKPAPR